MQPSLPKLFMESGASVAPAATAFFSNTDATTGRRFRREVFKSLAIKELRNLGYKVEAKGGKISYRLKRGKQPDQGRVRSLLDQIKSRKEEALAFLKHEKAQAKDILAVDLETTGLKPTSNDIRLVAWAGKGKCGVEESPGPLKNHLADSSVEKVFHNAAFDVHWLEQKGYPVKNYTDTMIMAQVLSNNRGGHDLATLAQRELGVELDKELQHSGHWIGPLSNGHYEYARRDAEVTRELALLLEERIERSRLNGVLKRELAALPAIIRLQRDGIPFDRDAWLGDLAKHERVRDELAVDIKRELGTEVNLSSPAQLKQCLRNRGLRLRDTSDDTLARLEAELPVIGEIRRWRELQRLTTSYGQKILDSVDPDGRIRANWRLIGTTTGRMSCSNPNLQQMPRVVRPYFRTKPGKSFVIADYSQIELRVLAELSGDRAMAQAFMDGEDLHARTASMILKKDSISKAERQVAKAANFGLIYGMTAKGLQARVRSQYGLQITQREAEKFRKGFFTLYPGVRRWHDRQLVRSRIASLGGREWRNLPRAPRPGWRNRLNYPVQCSAAEGLKESLALLIGRLPDNWNLCAVVHDEIVLEVPNDDVKLACELLQSCMIDGMTKIIPTVPVKVDVTTSETWAK